MQTILFMLKLLIVTNTHGIVRKILGPSVCTHSFDNLGTKIGNEQSIDHDIVLVPLRSAVQWCLVVSTIQYLTTRLLSIAIHVCEVCFIPYCRLCTSERRNYIYMHRFIRMLKLTVLPSKCCKYYNFEGIPNYY